MTASTDASLCGVCGSAIGDAEAACGHCGATPQWRNVDNALRFARAAFADWRDRNLIDAAQWEARDQHLATALQRVGEQAREGKPVPPDIQLSSPSACWRCARPVAGFYSYCNTCGAPLGQAADTLRYLAYLARELSRTPTHELTLAQINACTADVQRQMAALRAELETGRLSPDALTNKRLDHLREMKSTTTTVAVAAAPIASAPAAPAAAEIIALERRSILEILLDPRNIQWLLGSGGGLLVAGLVIWLASLGVFKNALVVAGCMGVGTAALLAGGCSIVKLTRYQLAGRAITLLACLIMPLNLWFYHAHGLVTLDGHLWAAALVCCALYAMAAAVLEDPLFVYVLSAGVAMTGLLILFDLHQLMETAAPSTLLVVLGLIALHVERACADNDVTFSRKRFGMACFWSAQALLGAGLLWLMGAQLAGTFPIALSWMSGRAILAIDSSQHWLTVGLVLAGAYAYLYSDLVVRRVGVYVYLSAFALLWAQVLVVAVTQLLDHPAVVIAALSLIAGAVNAAQALALSRRALDSSPRLARALPVVGLILTAAPVLLGVTLDLRANAIALHDVWPYSMNWTLMAAIALVALCCRISALVFNKHHPRLSDEQTNRSAASDDIADKLWTCLLQCAQKRRWSSPGMASQSAGHGLATSSVSSL